VRHQKSVNTIYRTMKEMEINDIQKNILLSPYTTYKIGGPADYFLITKTKDELVNAIINARKNGIPYFVLGIGANILFGDKGFRGLVIKNEARNINVLDQHVTADSGTTIEELINITLEKNLSGFEHFAGIPSTVGGALWQNLHFLSPDRKETIFIESIIESSEILDDRNVLRKVPKEFFEFGYDTSILHYKNILVTEVTFKLEKGAKENIQKQINENIKWRNEKQPQLKEFPSCGSVFKKIEGVGAGRLIEQVGLKGYKIGGAQISEKHANYIVNTGNATALDVRGIISLVQEKVKNETGYNLNTEIGFIGEF